MLIMPSSQLDQALQHGRTNDDVSSELLVKSDTADAQYSIKAQHAQRGNTAMDIDTDADADADVGGDADADSLALASVITQVTAVPEPPQTHVANGSSNGTGGWGIQHPGSAEAGPKGGWRTRFKSLLCCFAPPNNYYHYRSTGNDPGANSAGSASAPYCMPQTQLAAPPQPPRVYREAVIGPRHPDDLHKKTLVLDLDETLVHSSFKPIPNPDYIIPVEIDGRLVDVYVLKRPWLDHFLTTVGPRFEVVVFTASLAKYADPLLDLLDKSGSVRWRLFRESCCPYEGNYVKDLLCLGRDLESTIIVDNSPHSYVFQPQNALPIGTFIDNMEDQELLEIMPALLKVENVDDVRRYLGQHLPKWHSTQA